MNNQPQEYYTPYQLKFPVEIEKIIETTDPVYTFCEVMNHIDLSKYLMVLSISLDTFYSNKNYAARKI